MKRLKISQAIFFIIFSTFIISGFNYLVFSQIKKIRKNKYIDSRYDIKAIVQNQENDLLDANYLAELMHLSIDKPANLFSFDINKAIEKVQKSPLIKEIDIKKVKPNLLHVDCKIKRPVAMLYDFENVAIDEEGFLLPLTPFFNKLDLCSIYLDLETFEGFKKIEKKEMLLALDILKNLQKNEIFNLVKINLLDVSKSQLKSYGKREIILQVQEEIVLKKDSKEKKLVFPMILRLSKNNYLSQMGNYLILRKRILKDYENQFIDKENLNDIVRFSPKTIDLRISKLAFIDK